MPCQSQRSVPESQFELGDGADVRESRREKNRARSRGRRRRDWSRSDCARNGGRVRKLPDCALGAGPFRQGSALSTPSIFATTGSIQPKCSMSRSCEGPVGTNRTASNPSRDVFLDRGAINDVTCQLKYCFTSFRGAIWKGMRKCAIGNQARSVCVTQMVRRAIYDAAAYFGFFRDGRRFRDVPRT